MRNENVLSSEEIQHESKPERLKSLDILRGFDMFWITGGEGLVFALGAATGWGFMKTVEEQMHHVKWAGFHFYDLILQ